MKLQDCEIKQCEIKIVNYQICENWRKKYLYTVKIIITINIVNLLNCENLKLWKQQKRWKILNCQNILL